MSLKVLGAVIAGASALGASLWALDLGELGLGAEPSDNYRIVQKDQSWLDYLPAEADGVEIDVGSMNVEQVEGSVVRRVDLFEKTGRDSVALCFAESEATLKAACPGVRILGKITRKVDARWLGQLGESRADFLALLDLPAPTLKRVESTMS